MKRDKNLHPLSWDHHAALTAVVLTRRQLDSEPDAATLVRTVEQFVAFHAEALLPHFRHEEEWLLPAFLKHTSEDDPMILRLFQDHVALHALVADLRPALADPPSLPDTLVKLCDRLEAHVRFEERELFPRIEAALSADELDAIGKQLHETRALPVVIPASDGQRVSPGPMPDLSDD